MKEYLSPKMDILYVTSTDIMILGVSAENTNSIIDSVSAGDLTF